MYHRGQSLPFYPLFHGCDLMLGPTIILIWRFQLSLTWFEVWLFVRWLFFFHYFSRNGAKDIHYSLISLPFFSLFSRVDYWLWKPQLSLSTCMRVGPTTWALILSSSSIGPLSIELRDWAFLWACKINHGPIRSLVGEDSTAFAIIQFRHLIYYKRKKKRKNLTF